MVQGLAAMRSMRPGTCGAVDSRSAIVSAGTPRPQAQAATPNALATLKRPSNGSWTGALPIGVTRSEPLAPPAGATGLALHRLARRVEGAERPDRPRRLERREHVPREDDRRGLAARPGHAHEIEPRGRPPVPGLGGDGRRAAAVLHEHLGDGDGLLLLHERRDRAPRGRGGDEAVAVLHRAAPGP